MLEDSSVQDCVQAHSENLNFKSTNSNSNIDKQEKTTLKVFLSNGNSNIVKFGETTDVKVFMFI